MTLSAGSRLGPYEIVARLGAGGMGEVWRARDTRLGRTVAIKALPNEFATDERLRLRLAREAKAISSLNHPNICTLYDVGDAASFPYLVMEYVEGESLAERLARGPLPVDQVMRHGMEIADALERAHKAGIVHRDLKPGNIMLTKAGAKLLDFGLAKPLPDVRTDADAITKSVTEDGHCAGTLPYMAPEQIAGGEVDHRADLFALGAVLSEMATGRRLFGGNRAEVITGILTGDPAPTSSPALDRVVRTCLAKDPDERFQSAHDVKLALRWIADDSPGGNPSPSSRLRMTLTAGALLLAVMATVLVLWRFQRVEPPRAAVRLSIIPPAGHQFDFLEGAGAPAISPDGTSIVFPASKDGVRRLWLRRLDSLVAEPLAGSEDAISPFWSPDGRSIGFFANDKLMKLEIGRAPLAICDAPHGRGGTWSADGTILFAGRATPIFRVPASGTAAPVAVTALDRSKGDTTHRWPVFLPDGRHFLYFAAPSGQTLPTNQICVGSLDRKMRKVVLTSMTQPLFLDGHLLFVRDDRLHAQRFDTKALAVTGEPVTLSEQPIEIDRGYGRSIVSVSPSRMLVYQAALPLHDTRFTWYARSGKELGIVGEPGPYAGISLSRDGRFLYFSYRSRAAQSNIWSYDVERGVKTRVTFGNTRDTTPIVSPDGTKLVYTSITPPRQGSELRLRDLGSGTETTLLRGREILTASDWASDGRTLLLNNGQANPATSLTRVDLFWLTLDERALRTYLQTPDIESLGRFSPDGKWVAYQSDQSGPLDVYLSPFPPTGATWQISEKGGSNPRWREDGSEIYYAASDGRLMAVPVSLGATPVIGRPQLLFRARSGSTPRLIYAAAPDGQRFLISTRSIDEPPQPVTVVLNFDGELRATAQRR